MVRLDERSASFLALGIGLATGMPAVLLTTSGTAGAEAHAAVVEADLAGVPLLVVTADRPPELRGVGAPQTVDQVHLFGRAVRWFVDPGVADGATSATWRSLAARCLAEAVAGPLGPGPVHCNLPFREPLVGDAARAGGAAVGRPDGRPWHVVPTGPRDAPVDWPLAADPGGRRGLVVAGAGCGEPEAVRALGAAMGWPVLADPRSGVHAEADGIVALADGVLRSDRFAASHRPEIVVQLGARWASKVVSGFVADAARSGAELVVVDPFGRWPDPDRLASAVVRADPSAACRAWVDHPCDHGTAGSWWDAWVGAEAAARTALAAAMDGRSLDEPTVARTVHAVLPAGATLVVSSSMPVRDVEAFAAPRPDPPRVLANRGANGIDGVVSTALGVAIACDGPVVALVGDLAFLHDLGALVAAARSPIALTVVVVDNGGGGIFSFLEQADAFDGETFDLLFGTPQAPDVAAAAAGLGWAVDDLEASDGRDALVGSLARRIGSETPAVIRVRVPDRGANVAIHRELQVAIATAVDATAGASPGALA